jgi:4'-phosphopantetheinyl transferase
MALNVTIWRIALAEPGVEPLAAGILSADETARAARFVRPHDQRRFVLGRAALRGLLGAALAIAPRDVPITVNAHGKPSVAGAPLSFNLSHSQDWALLAIGPPVDLGIDIEAIAPAQPGLAERFFAPAEAAALARVDGAAHAAAFTRVWTRKEAVVKAIGMGLSAPLERFVVPHEAADVSRLLACGFDADLSTRLQLLDCPAPDGFLASLAIAAGSDDVSLAPRSLASLRSLLAC